MLTLPLTLSPTPTLTQTPALAPTHVLTPTPTPTQPYPLPLALALAQHQPGAEPEEFPFGPPLAVTSAEPPAADGAGFGLQRAAAARVKAPGVSQSPRRGGKKGGKDVFTSLLR